MIRKVEVTANECECEVCHHVWLSLIETPSRWCANKGCRSRQWNGKGKPSYINKIRLPAPRKKGGPRMPSPTLINEDE